MSSRNRRRVLETINLSDDDESDVYHLSVTTEESDGPSSKKGKSKSKRLGVRRKINTKKQAENIVKDDTVKCLDPIDGELKSYDISSQEVGNMTDREKQEMLQVLKISSGDKVQPVYKQITDDGLDDIQEPGTSHNNPRSMDVNDGESSGSAEIPVIASLNENQARAHGKGRKADCQKKLKEDEGIDISDNEDESFEFTNSPVMKTATETESDKESDTVEDEPINVKNTRAKQQDVKKKVKGRKITGSRAGHQRVRKKDPVPQESMLKYVKNLSEMKGGNVKKINDVEDTGSETEAGDHRKTPVKRTNILDEIMCDVNEDQETKVKKTRKLLSVKKRKFGAEENDEENPQIKSSDVMQGKISATKGKPSAGGEGCITDNRKIIEIKGNNNASVSIVPLSQGQTDTSKSTTSITKISLSKTSSTFEKRKHLEPAAFAAKLDDAFQQALSVHASAIEKKPMTFGFSDPSTDSDSSKVVSQKVTDICESLASTKESSTLSSDTTVYDGDKDRAVKQSTVLKAKIPCDLYTSDTEVTGPEAEMEVKKKVKSRVKKTPQPDPMDCDTNTSIFESDHEADLDPHNDSRDPADVTLVEEDDKCIQISFNSPVDDLTLSLGSQHSEPASQSSSIVFERDRSIQVSLASPDDPDEVSVLSTAELLSGMSKQTYIKKMKDKEDADDSTQDLFQSQPTTNDFDATTEEELEHSDEIEDTKENNNTNNLEHQKPVEMKISGSQEFWEDVQTENKKSDGEESPDILFKRSLRKRKAEEEPEIKDQKRPHCIQGKMLGRRLESPQLLSTENTFYLDLSSLKPDIVAERIDETPQSVGPVRQLVNKVKIRRKLYDPKPYYAPQGCSGKELESHYRRIKSYFDQYQVLLKDAQSRAKKQIPWGSPIKAGPHMANTIDFRSQSMNTGTSNVKSNIAASLFGESIDENDEFAGGGSKENLHALGLSRINRFNERYQLRNNRQPYVTLANVKKALVTASIPPLSNKTNDNKPAETISSRKFYAADTQDFDEDGDFQTLPSLRRRRKVGVKQNTSAECTSTAGNNEDTVNMIPETQDFDADPIETMADDNHNFKDKDDRKGGEASAQSLTNYLTSTVLKIGQSSRQAAKKALQKITLQNREKVSGSEDNDYENSKGSAEKEVRKQTGTKKKQCDKENDSSHYKNLLKGFKSPETKNDEADDNTRQVRTITPDRSGDIHVTVHMQNDNEESNLRTNRTSSPVLHVELEQGRFAREMRNSARMQGKEFDAENFEDKEQGTLVSETSSKRKSEDTETANLKMKKRVKDQTDEAHAFVDGGDHSTSYESQAKESISRPTCACPICGKHFDPKIVQQHAAECNDFPDEDEPQTSEKTGQLERQTVIIKPIQKQSVAAVSRNYRQKAQQELKQQWQDEDQIDEVHSSEDEWDPQKEKERNKRIGFEDEEDDQDVDTLSDSDTEFLSTVHGRASRGRSQRGAKRGGASNTGDVARGRRGRIVLVKDTAPRGFQPDADAAGRGGRARPRRRLASGGSGGDGDRVRLGSSNEGRGHEEQEISADPVDYKDCIICHKRVDSSAYEAHVIDCVNRQEDESNIQSNLQQRMKQEVAGMGQTRTRTRRQKIPEEFKDFIDPDDVDENQEYYVIEDDNPQPRAGHRQKQTQLDRFLGKSTKDEFISKTGNQSQKKNSINLPSSSRTNTYTHSVLKSKVCDNKCEDIVNKSPFEAVVNNDPVSFDNSVDGHSYADYGIHIPTTVCSDSDDSDESFVFNKHDVDTSEDENVQNHHMDNAKCDDIENNLSNDTEGNCSSASSAVFDSGETSNKKTPSSSNTFFAPRPFRRISEQKDGLVDFHNQFRTIENLDEYRAQKGTKRKKQSSTKSKTRKRAKRSSVKGKGMTKRKGKKKETPPVWIK